MNGRMKGRKNRLTAEGWPEVLSDERSGRNDGWKSGRWKDGKMEGTDEIVFGRRNAWAEGRMV